MCDKLINLISWVVTRAKNTTQEVIMLARHLSSSSLSECSLVLFAAFSAEEPNSPIRHYY